MDTDIPPPKIPFFKRYKKYIITVVVLLLFGLAGNWYIEKSTTKAPPSTSSILDSLQEEEVSEEGPVARVNGEEISRLDYQNRLKDITTALTRQRFNTTNTRIAAQIRQQAIAELVNFALLRQTAEEKGYTATPAQVEESYKSVVTEMGDEEVLELVLQDRDMTVQQMREQLRQQIIVDQYIEATIDLDAVTLEPGEVQEYYDTVSVNNTDIPSFDNVKDELTVQLLTQKQQQLVTDVIQTLRADAEIEILI